MTWLKSRSSDDDTYDIILALNYVPISSFLQQRFFFISVGLHFLRLDLPKIS